VREVRHSFGEKKKLKENFKILVLFPVMLGKVNEKLTGF